jgi:hypothetical protein
VLIPVEPLEIVLASALLSAIVSALMAKIISDRVIYSDNVIKERAKWRERVREIISEYPGSCADKKKSLERELITRINPYQSEDIQLIEALRNSNDSNYFEVSIRAALLLKHDWERSKDEISIRPDKRWKPIRRVTYNEFMAAYNQHKYGNKFDFDKFFSKLTEHEPWL